MGLLDEAYTSKRSKAEEETWERIFDESEAEEVPEETPQAAGEARPRSRPERKQRSAKRTIKPAKAKPPKKSRRAKGQGLNFRQVLILLLLGVALVVVYLLLMRAIRQTTPAPATQVATSTGESLPPTATPLPPTPTRAPTQTPAASPTPPQTPTPAPPVATQFDQQLMLNPDSIDLRLKRGAEYLRRGAYEAALADFEHVRNMDDQLAEAHLGIGRAQYALLNWPEAENAFLTAIALSPNAPEPHFELGMMYYMQGRYQEAAKEFDKAAEMNPDYAEAEAWLAIASARGGNVDEATGAVQRAVEITEKIAVVHIARAWVYCVQNPPDVDAAQAAFLYAQKLEPHSFEVLSGLARFYSDYRSERLAEAEQLAHYAYQWARNDLERARALQTLGHVYLAQGRKEEAKKVLAEAADAVTYEGQVLLFDIVEDVERALAP